MIREIREEAAAENQETTYGLAKEQELQIISAIHNEDKDLVVSLINDLHAAEVGQLIHMLSYDERKVLIDFIRDSFDPEILLELNQDVKQEVIELLGPETSAKVITNLETDEAVDVIEYLEEDELNQILDAVPKEQREKLEEGLAHPEDSAGRILEKNVVTVFEDWTVGETIDHMRSFNNLPQDFYQIFVVNEYKKPIGGVMLSRIMCSKRDVKIKDIMNDDLKLITADMDQEEVAFIFRRYALASAPVVDEDGCIIGEISLDKVVYIIDEEVQEDIFHLGGISETDLFSDLRHTIQRRFPWLAINLMTAVISAIVISFFEGEISRLATLAVLMPMVASMGGNAGTQTLTVAVRAIAQKELTSTNAFRVVCKEIMAGMLNGIVFALLAGMLIYFWFGSLALSCTFAFAIIITLLFAGLAGASIPLCLTRFGVDPAVASGVLLTTITDVVGFGSFLGMAAFMFSQN